MSTTGSTGGEFIDTNQWVPIHTLDGFSSCIEYYVNRLGQVKSSKGKVEKILKWAVNPQGYPTVTLTQRLGRKEPIRVTVHKLVAFAFLGLPPTPYGRGIGCTIIHHKDENKMNPCADNLAWVTRSENNNAGPYKRFYGRIQPGEPYSDRKAECNRDYMRSKREDPQFRAQEAEKQRQRRATRTPEEKEAHLARERQRDAERRRKRNADPEKLAKKRKYQREWAKRKRAQEKQSKIDTGIE